MSKLLTTLISYGAIPKDVLTSMTIQGLITPDQLLLHGSAQPPHESVDLGAMVHDIEAALREDHLPELLELVGEEGWVKPLDTVGWVDGDQELLKAWRSDGHVRFEFTGMLGPLPEAIHWWNKSETSMMALHLRDVCLVRHNDKVLVQAMLSKDEV